MTVAMVLALLAGTQAVFAALVLATQRRGNRTANRLLAGYFVVFAANMTNYAYVGLEMWRAHPEWAGLTRPLELLYGPCFYGYVRVLTGHRLTRRSAVHLLPFVVALGFLAAWLVQPIDVRMRQLEATAASGWPLSWPRWSAGWLLLTAYLVAARLELRRHERRLRDALSSLGRAGLRWLGRLTLVLLAGQAVELATAAALRWGHPLSSVIVANTLGMATMLYVLAFFALRQPALVFRLPAASAGATVPPAPVPVGAGEAPTRDVIVIPLAEADADEDAGVKYRRSGLSPEQADRLVLVLQDLMRTARPWRDAELSLPQLAERANSQPHHVSQALNERLGTTFFDFVNGYRVAEARRLLADPAHASRSVLTLAFEAGFNSKTAFNTSFKAKTGLTPTAYRRRFLGNTAPAEHTVA